MTGTVEGLAGSIPDRSTLVLPVDYAGAPMALVRALVRRGIRGLHLICAPTGGLAADILIGAGCVATIETSAVSLGEYGFAPRFRAAVEAGTLCLRDSTCPAIHAALQAGEKRIPFIPLRGIIGSDLLAARPDWKVIDNPFGQDDPIVLLPAIQPDVAALHAPLADRAGNVWIGRRRELMVMAHAATRTLVTVEAITDADLLAEERTAAGTIPALYVERVAPAAQGAWPLPFRNQYPVDDQNLRAYVAAARTQAGFDRYLAEHVFGRQRAAE
ncbi:MAG: CoA synthetase [Alphaproteobacteria bacterium]|nr:CoA synthetase [Alphaproteobacteria bacterium]